MIKYVIPRSERAKVLKRLDYLILARTLSLDTRDSLMETLAYREIEKQFLAEFFISIGFREHLSPAVAMGRCSIPPATF